MEGKEGWQQDTLTSEPYCFIENKYDKVYTSEDSLSIIYKKIADDNPDNLVIKLPKFEKRASVLSIFVKER